MIAMIAAIPILILKVIKRAEALLLGGLEQKALQRHT
jgi:hypothetical protein